MDFIINLGVVMAKKINSELEKLLKLCEEIAYDRKAENIIRLDLSEVSAVSDYFILCTAASEPHIRAVAERIQRGVLEKLKVKPVHVDGSPESGWIIVDFGNVMVHVMTASSRDLYQLEELWNDAPKTDAVKRIEAALKRRAAAEQKKVAPAKKKAAVSAKKAAAGNTLKKKTAKSEK